MHVESMIQTMSWEIARMSHARTLHNQVIAAEVQHGAQEIIALKHTTVQFENQKHPEVKRETSEEVHCMNLFSEEMCATLSTISGMKNQEEWCLRRSSTLG